MSIEPGSSAQQPRRARGSFATSAGCIRFCSAVGGGLRPLLRRVVVDLRVEVVCGGAFGSRLFGGVEHLVAALRRAGTTRSPRRPATPLPFRTVTVTFDGGGVFCLTLLPERGGVRDLRRLDVRVLERGRPPSWMSLDDAVQLELSTARSSIRSWKKWPPGSVCAKSAYEITWSRCSAWPPSPDLDVLRDRVDEARDAACTRSCARPAP